ncbi:MAG: ZIP family metal transporter [Treponema sp.]|nr:ZIP family metal transporter [Treponema sp.]
MLQIIIFSAIAGICGMGLGGIVSAVLLKKPSDKMICWLLSFAAGVMVSIVCFGLIPEALELGGIAVSVSGLVLGVVIVMGLNYLVDKITISKKEMTNIHTTHEELFHESQLINNPARLLRSGVIILLTISLHNIPEGIAIGAGGSYSFQLGALLALMIAIHNIPEGMAVAAPLLAGGINKWKVIVLTALSGTTTLLGGFIGILIGSISNFAIAMSLAAAGGAMLYVVFGEIMPQSIIMTKNRTASIVTLFGVIVGLIATKIL